MNKFGGTQQRLLAQAGLVAIIATAAPMAHAADRYSAFVIDTQTHEVLHDEAGDELRYPASLTKMMTLYMLFDELKQGRIHLNDKMSVSRHASRQAPTKLGLRPGHTIRVEDAIRGIVTKSANDAAVVVAERLGGSETHFAANMTSKAHQIGMGHTTFVNASGLPDMRQRTTARDIAVLSERLIEDFPQYYAYFQTPGMNWGRRYAANHNHLLGQVEGVDGIKTGYTNASGYNLASATIRNGRRVIAVVMGGQTASARDAQVAYLIENAYADLHARDATAPATASFASMPITKANVDFNANTLRLTTTAQDRIQYSAPAPGASSLIAGSALGASSLIAGSALGPSGGNSNAAKLNSAPGAPLGASAQGGAVDPLGESKGLF
jgi:D-alanyl-D-alanine carboxypeptidase